MGTLIGVRIVASGNPYGNPTEPLQATQTLNSTAKPTKPKQHATPPSQKSMPPYLGCSLTVGSGSQNHSACAFENLGQSTSCSSKLRVREVARV